MKRAVFAAFRRSDPGTWQGVRMDAAHGLQQVGFVSRAGSSIRDVVNEAELLAVAATWLHENAARNSGAAPLPGAVKTLHFERMSLREQVLVMQACPQQFRCHLLATKPADICVG